MYDSLRARIESGAIPVEGKLPTQDALVVEFGVSAITVRRALDMLRDDGLIVRRPRIGSVVVSDVVTTDTRSGRELPLLGCLLTNFDDTFGTHVLTGVLDAAEGHAEVIVKRSLGGHTAEEHMLAELIDAGCAGIMLLPSSSLVVPPAVLQLTAERFPLVILDRIFDTLPVSTVCSDNFAGAQSATEYLFSLGHRNLGLILPRSTVSTIDERRNGFIYAHAALHMAYLPEHEYHEVRSVVPGDIAPIEEDISGLIDFLEANPHLTGFLVSEYKVAQMLVEAGRQIGRRCPESLSVVCFDHPPVGFEPQNSHVTHVRQDQARMGRTALEQVLLQVADRGAVAKHVLPTSLVVGGTTAAPTVG
ncbi:GntR family transcriptional regulator [Sanguibacter gelidistatuariae]|uniref:GntR family transcriptional regulator n=1 Tax=Sanguibacter gelidistatuariae TaxID=1814289 RepID=UPI00111420D5|nr:GntR family transcriptional regulator [Sanguibacter gelidistatuariae]